MSLRYEARHPIYRREPPRPGRSPTSSSSDKANPKGKASYKRPTRRRPSVKGELKSGIAKKKASRRVSNPKAKRALSKRHPRTPRPTYDRPRFF